MHWDLTPEQKQKLRRRKAVRIVAIVAVVAVLVVGYGVVSNHLAKQSSVAMETLIIDKAKLCFSAEGSYPRSVEYLEENYGLILNHEKFDIQYDAKSEGVMPEVSVKPR